MLEAIHRLGSRIRHSSLLDRQSRLWAAVEPAWQSAFRFAAARGFRVRINDDVFQLEYGYAARYDRRGAGVYEPSVFRALVAVIREGMIVFDVSAHIGLLTLAAAKPVGPRGHVFAFEPATETFETLRHHISMNDYADRIEAIRAVVGNADGVAPFFVYGDSMSASVARENLDVLSPQRLSDPELRASEITVPTLTLDRFAEVRGVDPDVLKIDVEGAELLVLRGARELFRRKAMVVVCEVHPLQMRNCGSSVGELEQWVAGIGYALERLDEPGPQGIFHVRISKPDRP